MGGRASAVCIVFAVACIHAQPRPPRVARVSIVTVDSMHGDRSELVVRRDGCFESESRSSQLDTTHLVRGCLPREDAAAWFRRADRIALVEDVPPARPHAAATVFVRDDESAGTPGDSDFEAVRHVADLRSRVRALGEERLDVTPSRAGFLSVRVRDASLSSDGAWSCTTIDGPAEGEYSFEEPRSLTAVGRIPAARASTVLDRVLVDVLADALEPVAEGASPAVVVRHRDRDGAVPAAQSAAVIERWNAAAAALDEACRR